RTTMRGILTPAFALNDDWNQRHSEIKKLGLGGDYEWIATIQKKWIGGGHATAVDVDVAVCMGEEKDQVDDLLDMIRKLRHSPVASRLAHSSQYALLRLLLKHNYKEIIELALDPMNNGVFANDHSACLILDHLIEKKDWKDAVRVCGWMMQQEEYGSELLNCLCLYSCLRWMGDPIESRIDLTKEEEEINEDDILTLKMAFLKNEWNDNHLDLVHLPPLVAKTVNWLTREMKLDDTLKGAMEAISTVVSGSRISSIDTLSPATARLVYFYLSTLADLSEEDKEYIDEIKVVSESGEGEVGDLAQLVLCYMEKIQETEEMKLMEAQKNKFMEWNRKRRSLIEAQTKRLQLKMTRSEMERELADLRDEEQRLFFFENRLLLEKSARENAEIANE
ncbi:hypothetical protein PFISCL1PPCAC_19983, partial [Pristionchus fissidentatus]